MANSVNCWLIVRPIQDNWQCRSGIFGVGICVIFSLLSQRCVVSHVRYLSVSVRDFFSKPEQVRLARISSICQKRTDVDR